MPRIAKKLILSRIQAPAKPAIPMIDEEYCIGCGICIKVCPVEGLNKLVDEYILEGVKISIAQIQESAAATKIAISPTQTIPIPEYCISCRRCVEECPTEARIFP